jgi:hypothetical protein
MRLAPKRVTVPVALMTRAESSSPMMSVTFVSPLTL